MRKTRKTVDGWQKARDGIDRMRDELALAKLAACPTEPPDKARKHLAAAMLAFGTAYHALLEAQRPTE